MVRRIVTGHDDKGNPIIVSDGIPAVSSTSAHIPGSGRDLIWSTVYPAGPSIDPTPALTSVVPGPGQTVGLVISFPPDTAYTSPGIDFAAVGAEIADTLPGLAELFEADDPGAHQTPTVDYAVVLSGSVVLDLGGGRRTEVLPGDIVVQNGTRHAWRNPGTEAASVFFVLVGSERTV